jgi:EmrB/QacA subfamily drug resistance transporter
MEHAHDHRPNHPRVPWTVLAIVCVAQFMVILDVTVVNVALPAIGDAFGTAAGDLQWAVTAYLLFGGSLLLLGGRASDLIGRRRVFLAGLTVFTAASLGSGLAWSEGSLVVARAAQGVGAALLSPAALSIVTTTYAGPQRATALAVWGGIGAAGGAIGLVLGGMLTTWLSWRWIFAINVPIGLVTAVIALRAVPASGGRVRAALARLDLPGAALATGALVLLVLATDGVRDHGWGSARTLGLYAAAAAAFAAFASVERAVRRPLVTPAIWRVRSLTWSAFTMLAGTGLLIGTFFLNSVLLQDGLGWSALETGLAFLPMAVMVGAGVHLASHLLPRVGTRAVGSAGLALAAGGAAVLATIPAGPSYAADVLPGLLLIGAGMGPVFVAVNVTAMSDVDHDRAGLASGLMTTAHEIGGAVGVAVLASVLSGATGGLAAGYADAFTVSAVVAGVLSLLVLAGLPVRRPVPGAQVAMH